MTLTSSWQAKINLATHKESKRVSIGVPFLCWIQLLGSNVLKSDPELVTFLLDW